MVTTTEQIKMGVFSILYSIIAKYICTLKRLENYSASD